MAIFDFDLFRYAGPLIDIGADQIFGIFDRVQRQGGTRQRGTLLHSRSRKHAH